MENNIKERVYLAIIVIVAIAFFLSNYAAFKDVESYKLAYKECMESYYLAESGRLPMNGAAGFLDNITISQPVGANNCVVGTLEYYTSAECMKEVIQ